MDGFEFRRLRELAGLTRRQAAELMTEALGVYVAPMTLYYWETGRRRSGGLGVPSGAADWIRQRAGVV